MNITENAKQYHEKMFPGYVSKFLETDPEFIERFDNFAFDEVVNQDDLDDKTRFIAILATLVGCQGIDEYRCMMPDVASVHRVVEEAEKNHGRIDVAVSNAGYGLFGCAEELTDEQIDHIIATNLTGSIALIRSVIPHMRKQGGGRIIQISSYGGQVAYPANSMYHATKFGIEGFCEAVAQEVAQFNIGVTIVEPGGARTEFRYGSAKVANLMPEYDSCHGFLNMLDKSKGLAVGDPVMMAARIIESANKEKAPLRMVLGSQALSATVTRLKERVADYETQTELAASTDIHE